MPSFQAHEFDRATTGKTGAVEVYSAPDLATAVQHCLYTKQLVDGTSHMGPTRKTVYTRTHIYSLVKE